MENPRAVDRIEGQTEGIACPVPQGCSFSHPRMKSPRTALLLGVLLALTGCTPVYTNLTPRTAVQKAPDVYHFEVQWDTSQRGANTADVKAYVVIGENFYPMERVGGTKERWEVDVPITGEKTIVPYRYKFDYTFPTILNRLPESSYSAPYFLDLRKVVSGNPPAGR